MPTLEDLARELGGELHGPAELVISSPGPYDDAGHEQIVVAFDSKALAVVEKGHAAAAVVPRGLACELPSIEVDDPKRALVQLLHLFEPPVPPAAGVHEKADVHPSARLGVDVTVGPYAVIEAGAVIGERCRIGPHCVIGEGAVLGDDVLLHANVTLYAGVKLGNRVVLHSGAVIGGNGFGFRTDGGRHVRIPQIGGVVLEDDVELGCNTCIDRATLGVTRIGRGSKMDNLVQVGHNSRIGEDVILAGQSGVAGSTRLGNRVVLGGQAGVADHLTIGDDVKMGAQAGVVHDVVPGAELMGTLAIPVRQFMQITLLLRRLHKLFKRVSMLERIVGV